MCTVELFVTEIRITVWQLCSDSGCPPELSLPFQIASEVAISRFVWTSHSVLKFQDCDLLCQMSFTAPDGGFHSQPKLFSFKFSKSQKVF